MGFPSDTSGRASQSKYWTLFGVYMIAVPVLLIGGLIAIVQGSIGLGLMLIVAIVPLGIYWRVIMMRRCRDIGWPAFLPWLIFGLQFATSFGISSGSVEGAGPGAVLSMLALPLLLGLADFVFSIVIGCIGTKQGADYAAVFGDGPEPSQRTRPAGSPDGEGPDRFDDAIARALEAHRRGESVVGAPSAPRPAPAMPGRPAGTFGRRII
jgi:uncharacterized membrane protein YhaH (DUF805 family)